MWKSVFAADGDLIVWCDADITNFDGRFVIGLLGPLLERADVGFVKGYYDRPVDGKPGTGGRVTELVARPLISLLFPRLAGIVQPLSGEYAGRREVLEAVPFVQGYGVDLGLLVDISHRFGMESIAQVDLGVRLHRNRTLDELSPQALAVMQTAFTKAGSVLAPAELANARAARAAGAHPRARRAAATRQLRVVPAASRLTPPTTCGCSPRPTSSGARPRRREVAAAVGRAVRAAGGTCDEQPVADGGEGFLDVLGGRNRTTTVMGPLGDPVDAGWRLSGGTAVIEMARASGLALVGGAEGNDPVAATTYGTGELICGRSRRRGSADPRRRRRLGDHRRGARGRAGRVRATPAAPRSSCSSPATCARGSSRPPPSSPPRRAQPRRRSRS